MTYVYKIWDKRFKTYTVNQGRISSNNFHPGRVYFDRKAVEQCMKLCDEFYGDADEKEVHRFTLTDREVIDL